MNRIVSYDNGVVVNTSPDEVELIRIGKRVIAMRDVVLHTLMFCPMKKTTEAVPRYEWSIVTVDGFSIPAAKCEDSNKNESILYTTYDSPVILSHAECALTTAWLYLDISIQMRNYFENVANKDQGYRFMLAGLNEIYALGDKQCYKMLDDIRENLTSKGRWVLD